MLRSPVLSGKTETEKRFENLYKICYDVTKCIIQSRELSTNQETLNKYCEELTHKYNAFIDFSLLYSIDLESTLKEKFIQKIQTLKTRVADSFLRLKLKFNFDENIFQRISDSSLEISFEEIPEESGNKEDDDDGIIDFDISDIQKKTLKKSKPENSLASNIATNNESIENKQTLTIHHVSSTNITGNTQQNSFVDTNSTLNDNNDNFSFLETGSNSINMELPAFLRLASGQIHEKYNGNPLGLDSFIRSVQLLKSVSAGKHDETLKQFILTKVEDKAAEYLTEEPNTVDEIIAILKSKVKPDNSDIISGKLNALRADKMSMSEFSKTAEELADSLKRSLMFEGIPRANANQLVIKEMINVCRISSKSDIVKSVLEASTFEEPKDIIAKFLIQSTKNKDDKQILVFNQNNRNNQTQFRGQRYQNNFNRNFRGNYNGYQNSYNNHGRYRNNNYSRNNYNNNNNRNYGNTQRNNNYNRGFRRQNFRSNNFQENRNNNTQNVRMAGNSMDSQDVEERSLGDQMNSLTIEN